MTLFPSCLGPQRLHPHDLPSSILLLGLLLRGLESLGASELGCRGVLLGSLGSTDGADAGDGVGTEVGAVVALGETVGNALVGPVCRKH